MAVAVKRVVFEILKPRNISTVELSKYLSTTDGTEQVDVTVNESDDRTETLDVTISGSYVNCELALKIMRESGVTINGIDEINVVRIRKLKSLQNS